MKITTVEHLKAVEPVPTGKRVALKFPSDCVSISQESRRPDAFKQAEEYVLRVEFGGNILMDDETMQVPAFRDHTVRTLKRAVVDGVYGEIRRELLSMIPIVLQLSDWEARNFLDQKIGDMLRAMDV